MFVRAWGVFGRYSYNSGDNGNSTGLWKKQRSLSTAQFKGEKNLKARQSPRLHMTGNDIKVWKPSFALLMSYGNCRENGDLHRCSVLRLLLDKLISEFGLIVESGYLPRRGICRSESQ